ncbi:MAG: 30S ribosomal protein S8e [Candidatus Bathyarchaeota archaeon]|jgi:small subunit ribosomal protein S8e|nr:30S ribosomal protein S8e [Candidatus Bathyarchaeota archaeon]
MPQWHGGLTKRKKSGGRRRAYRGKRAFETGGEPTQTSVGEVRLVRNRSRGGNSKPKLLASNQANVTDPSSRVTKKVEIVRVVKNPSNVDYERRGIITKGAIIETPLGQAQVTSRPGQDGVVNAILLKSQ